MIRKRVLVTGGGGFVGSHMAAGYQAMGHDVTAFDAAFDTATSARLAGVDRIEAALSQDNLAALVGRFDLVLHAAAVTSRAEDRDGDLLRDLRSNIDMLADALDYAIESGAGAFVFLSSSGVFAAGDGGETVDEQTPATATTAYAVAKRCGELIMTTATGLGCRLVTVRLGPLYGPYEMARATRARTSLVRQLLDAAGGAFHLNTPNARRDWTFVEDLPLALEAVLAQCSGDLLAHLGSGDILTDRQLAKQIILHLDTPIDLSERPAPYAAVKAPMVSGLPTDFQWTPLDIGLTRTLAKERRP